MLIQRKHIKYLFILFLWGSMIIPSNGQGQRASTLDSLYHAGDYQTLSDSIFKGQLNKDTKTYYQFLYYITQCQFDKVDQALEQLSNRERSQVAIQILEAKRFLAEYKIPEGQELLSKLEKMRIRNEDDKHNITLLETQVNQLSRMLNNVKDVEVIAFEQGTKAQIIDRVRELAIPRGEYDQNHFITENGRIKWQVTPNKYGGSSLTVSYRLGDGTWEAPQPVTMNGIDSLGMIAYPYLLSDGSTIYFAYRSPQSVGGYDLYVTRYNAQRGELLVPQQLPLPYNSIADDLLYVYDDQREMVWFASTRGVGTDSLSLYGIKDKEKIIPDSLSTLSQQALLLSPTVNESDEISSTAQTRIETAKTRPTPLILINGKAIYNLQDVKSEDHRSILRQYLRYKEQVDSDLKELEQIRSQIIKDPSLSMNKEIRNKILITESNIRSNRQQMKALLQALAELKTL